LSSYRVAPEQIVLEGAVGLDKASHDASFFFQLTAAELSRGPYRVSPRPLLQGENSALWQAFQPLLMGTRPAVADLRLCSIFDQDGVIAGFLLLGVSTQASNDDEMCDFACTLTRTVSTSVGEFFLRKQLRDVKVASEALLRRAEEAGRSNFMFRHMAESATVGCAIFDHTGRPMWLNEAYLNLTGVRREDFRPGIWQKAIVPEDLPEVEGNWEKLASGEPILPFTFRVKRHHDPTAKPGSCESLNYRWLLSNACVDFNEDGSCRRVMGWLTDISAQKWNEHLRAQRLADALETKRQTEKFIDMACKPN
jgi:PAS domain S-box-containing protein